MTGYAIFRFVKNINEAAKALGRLGGLKGGKARAQSLSAERRKEIAQKAAAKRWQKKKLDLAVDIVTEESTITEDDSEVSS